MSKLIARADNQYQQVAFAEVLVPNTPNVFNDYWTEPSIVEAAYAFMVAGFGIGVGIDVNHDNEDVIGKVFVVESFIAREGDTDFIPGSWVVGVYIPDADLWQKVLGNEINGFSYEALVEVFPAVLQLEDDGVRVGTTEPSESDGHVHDFVVIVGLDNRPVSGGTSETNGHSHTVTTHTITDEADGHTHRYTLVVGEGGK